MKSYNSVTSVRRSVAITSLVAIGVVNTFGMSLSAAQDVEPVPSVAEDDVVEELQPVEAPVLDDEAPATEAEAPVTEDDVVAELVLQLEERDARIAVLHEQLAVLQQSVFASEHAIQEHRDTLLDEREEIRSSDRFQEEAMEQWRMGYSLGGGQNLRAFESIILPCESGGEPDPDAAVGPTDDWGRAQINRPTWSNRFTELTGASFEEHIGNPILNGFMAAHVETEQGLSAWTCWRKR